LIGDMLYDRLTAMRLIEEARSSGPARTAEETAAEQRLRNVIGDMLYDRLTAIRLIEQIRGSGAGRNAGEVSANRSAKE
jgi:hypothetical protein